MTFRYKCLLVLVGLFALGVAATFGMMTYLSQYGLEQFFRYKGFDVQVGQVKVYSMTRLHIQDIRLSQTVDKDRSFEFVIKDVNFTVSLFDFLIRRAVGQFTFDESFLILHGLSFSFFNPLDHPLFPRQYHTNPNRIMRFHFTNAKGLIAIESLFNQRMNFDLFSMSERNSAMAVNGILYRDKGALVSNIKFNDIFVHYLKEGSFDIDFSRKGQWSGQLLVEQGTDYTSLKLHPFFYRVGDVFSYGEINVIQRQGEQARLRCRLKGSLWDGRMNLEVLNKPDQFDCELYWKPNEEGAAEPREFKAHVSNQDNQRRFELAYLSDYQIRATGQYLADAIEGELLILRPGQKKNEHLNWRTYRQSEGFLLELDNIQWNQVFLPPAILNLDYVDQEIKLLKGTWDRWLEGSGVLRRQDERWLLDCNLNLKHFDLMTFTEALGKHQEANQPVMSGSAAGPVHVSGTWPHLEYQAGLKVRYGQIKGLHFEEMEFNCQGRGSDIMVNESRVKKEDSSIIFKGNLSYKNGQVVSDIDYETTGSSVSWGGWFLGHKANENEYTLERRIDDEWSIKIRNLLDEQERETETGRVSMELSYDVSGNNSLFMSLKDDDELLGYKRSYDF